MKTIIVYFFVCLCDDFAITLSDISNIANVIVALCAVIGIIYSAFEYCNYKQRERWKTFSEYSTRYANDENIEAVTQFLIEFIEGKEHKKELTTNQKEMFMRFFEELELQIENDRLDQDTVKDFFVYYAVAAAVCPEFMNDVFIEREGLWEHYKRIVKRYKDIRKCVQVDYNEYNENKELKFLFDLRSVEICWWRRKLACFFHVGIDNA